MPLGSRIGERIAALNISQSELARRTAIPQTTINSLIKSGRRSTPHLLKLARALQTTPAYLSGETDDPDADAPPVALLDAESREIVERFAVLTAGDRRAVMQLIRSLTNAGTATLHERRDDYRPRKA